MASFSANLSTQFAPSNVVETLKALFPKYFASMIIWGLVLSHSIVEYATVCTLMLYLTNELGKGLLFAAIVINVLDGLSAVFIFPFAYTGDHFNVLVFSIGSYTMGLILLWLVARFPSEFSMSYLAVVLIALGKSGRSCSLQSFLRYQLRERNSPINSNSGGNSSGEQRQSDVGTKIWWHSAWISGYAIAIFAQHDYDSWLNFQISALLMGASCLLFYFGFVVYDYEKPARMSLAHIFSVLKLAKPIKLLLWPIFIPYSLVLATGNTLFIAQVKNLDTHIGNNFRVRYSSLFVLKSLTCDLVVFLFWYLGRSKSNRSTHTGSGITLVRIGAGIICAAFCCVAAQQVEILRQLSIHEEGRSKISPPSVLLLTPQYCLLGVMEGLAGGGLFRYILGHVPGPRRTIIAKPLSELVLCVGKFLSIAFLLIFRFWIHQDISMSQLDRYFMVLAIVSSVFFSLYLCWVLNYGRRETYPENEESENLFIEMEYGHSDTEEENDDQAAEDCQDQIVDAVQRAVSEAKDDNEEEISPGTKRISV